MAKDKVKYTVTFPEKISNMIDEMSEKDSVSKPEIMRRAISLYWYIQNEVEPSGNKICIVGSDDKIIKEVVFR